MAAHVRTPQKREEDLHVIAELYVRGRTQQAIAEVIGVTREQIRYDLQEIRARWRESSVRDYDEAITIELEKIDRLEELARDAWDRSCRKKERKVEEYVVNGDEKRIRKRIDAGDEAPEGNPRFLERIAWCISKRCDLLGLNSPLKIAPTTPDGKEPVSLISVVRDMSDDELATLRKVRHRMESQPEPAAPKAGEQN